MQRQDGRGVAPWKAPSLRAPLILRAGLRHALDLILPPASLDGAERPFAPGLSARAWERVAWIEEPCCDGCGAPFGYPLGAGVRCAACEGRPRAFDRARCACLYDETSKALILKLKHGDRTDLAGLFAGWLNRAAGDLLETADAIAPVPMHRSRLFKRRYNQAAEIARALSRRSGVRYLPDALVRARDTGGQGGRSRRARREAVRGAFSVTPAAARRLAGKRILLVDDVLTTGATAEACAKALKQAGAAAVDVAAVARVQEAEALAI